MREVIEKAAVAAGDLVRALMKEIRILEITQEAQIQNNADS
jgi:hypothetical protein